MAAAAVVSVAATSPIPGPPGLRFNGFHLTSGDFLRVASFSPCLGPPGRSRCLLWALEYHFPLEARTQSRLGATVDTSQVLGRKGGANQIISGIVY